MGALHGGQQTSSVVIPNQGYFEINGGKYSAHTIKK